MTRHADPDPPRAQDAGADTSPPTPAAGDAEYRCDLCDAPMLEWHCRIICNACGYQRDCSDP